MISCCYFTICSAFVEWHDNNEENGFYYYKKAQQNRSFSSSRKIRGGTYNNTNRERLFFPFPLSGWSIIDTILEEFSSDLEMEVVFNVFTWFIFIWNTISLI